jgi:hypothetical protein
MLLTFRVMICLWHGRSPSRGYGKAGRNNRGKQNLLENPLGPGSGRLAFQHAGGEIIFNLPNGMQALPPRGRQREAHH